MRVCGQPVPCLVSFPAGDRHEWHIAAIALVTGVVIEPINTEGGAYARSPS
jgi:hypothetical protein